MSMISQYMLGNRILLISFLLAIFGSIFIPSTALAQQSPVQPSARAQIESEEGIVKDDWQFTLSAGSLVMPNYPGDDEYLVALLPNIQVRYKDILDASIQGIEVSAIRTGGFSAGPVARVDFGRDSEGAMPFAIIGGETDELDGLDEIGITAELGGFVRYQTGPIRLQAELRNGINGHESLVGSLSATYNTRLALGKTGAFLTVGPSLSFADSDYNNAFFGITPEASAASGLDTFEADGGLNSIGLDLTFAKPLNQRFAIFFFANYDRLVGDIADSPLVQERGSENQFMAGLFLSYTF
ncbi:MAG: MipA/OmpV family protein [Pseudomonadota bacterium]